MSIRKLALLLAVIVATCVGAETGHATNIRTWVSNVGNDTGSCTVTSPCLTFGYALTQTSSDGEINCLNPGGFGAVTINIPVTIDCEGASNGGITVTSGNAISISTTGAVTLIGLDIHGENAASDGVDIQSNAVVNIRNCKIYGFADGYAIEIEPSASDGVLAVDNVFMANNGVGIFAPPSTGVANMTVRNSNIMGNEYGIDIQAAGANHAGVTIEQTTLSFNGIGLFVYGAGAVALIGSSTVVNNATGVKTANGASLYSFKNNQIGGNSTDGTPLTAYPGGPLN